jgi:flagellar basal body-associated protein FliL
LLLLLLLLLLIVVVVVVVVVIVVVVVLILSVLYNAESPHKPSTKRHRLTKQELKRGKKKQQKLPGKIERTCF